VPGSDGNLADVDEALALANRIGYPVMLKATNGAAGAASAVAIAIKTSSATTNG